MEIKDVITNVNIYGLEDAIKGSKYPMSVNLTNVSGDVTPNRIIK